MLLNSKPDTIDIAGIKYQLERGELKVPQFQRDFVWSPEASSKLMDSILKGYPIGAFTFWKTKERLRAVKNVGGLILPESPSNDFVNYVLDGQQRITSIYACITGAVINKTDYRKMYIDLREDRGEALVLLEVSPLADNEYISIQDLLYGKHKDINARYNDDDILDRIQEYKDRINKYTFSVIELQEAPLDTATDIFTRINTSGKSLSVFEIMCAKTYDEVKDFDLAEKRKIQLEKWEGVNYDTVPDQTVLQAISLCLTKSCKRKDILNINKEKFIEAWDAVDKAFDEAIDYMKSFYGIPVSRLLPYDALLLPFVYYFYFHKTKPTGKNVDRLQDYFWRCVISKRFTEGMEGKLAVDCTNVIDAILADKDPEGRWLETVDISYDSIRVNGVFSLSSAYIKGLICILTAQHPRSFRDGAEVVIDNAWLSQSNSKNYHHFFPKAYMRRDQHLIPEDKVNHIANITIVDGYLNKNVIKDQAPATYMETFKNGFYDDEKFREIMRSHLIDTEESGGIWNNDYSTFFDNRIRKLQAQLKRRLMIRNTDKI